VPVPVDTERIAAAREVWRALWTFVGEFATWHRVA
jgi:hypothetical protein